MGGQACILYGAAEFTRDVDFAVAVGPGNLGRLRAALDELEAEPVFFPPLSAAALRRGHACHFRCRATGLHGLRIDLMSRMRGVDPFSKLWARREEFELPGVGRVATQRDKLRDLARRHPEVARRVRRAALRAAMGGAADRTAGLLRAEEDHERQLDRLYWAPLRLELSAGVDPDRARVADRTRITAPGQAPLVTTIRSG
jgi:hypothetical protein